MAHHVIYGPFEELSEGTYIALFRMKIDDNTSTYKHLLLEISNKSKGKKLSLKVIGKNEFYRPLKYQFFGLEFEYRGGLLEYRIFNIAQEEGNLWIDYIAVIKLS